MKGRYIVIVFMAIALVLVVASQFDIGYLLSDYYATLHGWVREHAALVLIRILVAALLVLVLDLMLRKIPWTEGSRVCELTKQGRERRKISRIILIAFFASSAVWSLISNSREPLMVGGVAAMAILINYVAARKPANAVVWGVVSVAFLLQSV